MTAPSPTPAWIQRHALALTVGVGLGGVAATIVFTAIGLSRVSEGNTSLGVGLETAAALIALLTAYLVFGRFARSGDQRDLLLASALTLVGFGNLLFSTIPSIAGEPSAAGTTWAAAIAHLMAAAALASAAFVPFEVARDRRATIAIVVATVTSLLLVAGFAGSTLGEAVPNPVRIAADEDIQAVAGIRIMLLVGMVLWALAAAGFARRCRTGGDELLCWFAVGCAVAAISRLNYYLSPSIYTDQVYSGDIARLVFYVVLLVGALREIQAYQRSVLRLGQLEERRRLARELHDGLSQDVAFIAMQAQAMARRSGADPALERLARVAAHAVQESRGAISALTEPQNVPLVQALVGAARDVASRGDAQVCARGDERAEVSDEVRHELTRIVREAVGNAVRHGDARRLTLDVESRPLRVAVSDDGSGFDVATVNGHGFGLTSMRERAQALGGDLTITSSIGVGTSVEVMLPVDARRSRPER